MARMETANRGKLTSIQQASKPSPKNTKVEVWDLFVRFFHWSLVVSFAAAYITGDAWRGLHIAAGYAALALIAARMLWGVAGTKYARFSQFLKPPAAVAAYMRDVFHKREARHLGHNPAGGAMVIAILILLSALCASGVLLTSDAFWGSETMDTIHGTLADIMVVCIAVHVWGVVFTSIRTRENLIWTMITGQKRAPDHEDRLELG